MMTSVGVGIIIGTALSFGLGIVFDVGLVGTLIVTTANLAIICALFLLVFRLGTSDSIKLHWLIPGAIIAGSGLLIVQHFGGYIMAHQLPKLRDTYGSFALALGMMFWIYLQVQIVLFALEITAVRARKDWPKKLFD
jgi:uncharacterized BrkB/YihY/UPF0761 family membrane protein